MEELTALKSFESLGIVGIVVVALLYFCWQVFKFFIENSIQSDKQLLEAKTKLNESVLKLSESVAQGNTVVMGKLEAISKELDDLASEDLVKKNHEIVMAKLEAINNEVKDIILEESKKN